jgi:hypothetical protein
MHVRALEIERPNVRERVLRGVDLLFQECDEEWPDRVDSSVLDISCAWSCVLGQLFGSYQVGRDRLSLHNGGHGERDPVSLGFAGARDGMVGLYGPLITASEMTEAWRVVLAC